MITDKLMARFSVLTRRINQIEHTIRSVDWLMQTEPNNKKFKDDLVKLRRRLKLNQNKLKHLLHANIKA